MTLCIFYDLTHAQCAPTTTTTTKAATSRLWPAFVLQPRLRYVHFQFLYTSVPVYMSIILSNYFLTVSSFALCRTRKRPFSCHLVARSRFVGNRTTCRQTYSRSVKSCTGQSSRGLVNSPKMFDLKFGAYNSSKCYFRQITLSIRCHYSIGLKLGLELGLVYK